MYLNHIIADIKSILKTVNLHYIAAQIEEILNKALNLLLCETRGREEKRFERHIKQASFPEYKALDEFGLKEQPSLSWIEQGYNLILLDHALYRVGDSCC